MFTLPYISGQEYHPSLVDQLRVLSKKASRFSDVEGASTLVLGSPGSPGGFIAGNGYGLCGSTLIQSVFCNRYEAKPQRG